MKKRIAIKISLAIIITSVVLSGVTFGYLTNGTNTKVNLFYPGVLTAPIFENGGLAPDNTNILQTDGTVAEKQVQITNVSNPHEADCYIRVMLMPAFRTSAGTLAGDVCLEPDSSKVTVTSSDGEVVTLHLASGWQNDWIYDNGYYYYKNIVHPSQSTTVLLDNVTVSDEELWDTFCLEVLSDAVQAENGAANSAWGSIANQLE